MSEKIEVPASRANNLSPAADTSPTGKPAGKDCNRTSDHGRTQGAAQGLSQPEISRAISFARIVLIIGLVFLHYGSFPNSSVDPGYGLDLHTHPFATWVNSAVLFFFFSVVPLLSMISGWLFFSFAPEDAWSAIRRRMGRRFVSLYLPLVAWNAFYLAAIFAFFVAYPHHPLMGDIGYTFPFMRGMDYVNAVFAITHRPIAQQFWFIRDLFVTALISPLFWLMIRYVPWLGAMALCLAWLANSHIGIFVRADVPFFFYMGALAHFKNPGKNPAITLPLRTTVILAGAYIILAGIRALAPYAVDFSGQGEHEWLDVATRLMRIAGVLGCWGMMYRVAQTHWGRVIGNYGGLAFFLYAAHWPLLDVLKMWLWPFMPAENDFWMLMHFVLSATLTITIVLVLGNLLALKAPRFFALMNGGRLLKQVTN